jgi:hypothetical protein
MSGARGAMRNEIFGKAGPVCPGCGGHPVGRSILIEVVEGEGRSDWLVYENFWNMLLLRHRRRIRRMKSPPFCAACASWLRVRRLIASTLTVMPLLLLTWWMIAGSGFFSYFLFFMYAYYLIGRGAYNLADYLTYGVILEYKLREWLPADGVKPGLVRFPVPPSYWALRLALFFVGAFIMLTVRDLNR